MKFICSKTDECNKLNCPHRHSHDDCGHTCERTDEARCVMDVASLPVIPKVGTVAIFFKRREARQ